MGVSNLRKSIAEIQRLLKLSDDPNTIDAYVTAIATMRASLGRLETAELVELRANTQAALDEFLTSGWATVLTGARSTEPMFPPLPPRKCSKCGLPIQVPGVHCCPKWKEA